MDSQIDIAVMICVVRTGPLRKFAAGSRRSCRFQVPIRTISVFDPYKPTKLELADAGSNAVALVDRRHDDVSVAVHLPRDANDGPDDRVDLLVVGNRLELDFWKQRQDVTGATIDDFPGVAGRIAVDASHAEARNAQSE